MNSPNTRSLSGVATGRWRCVAAWIRAIRARTPVALDFAAPARQVQPAVDQGGIGFEVKLQPPRVVAQSIGLLPAAAGPRQRHGLRRRFERVRVPLEDVARRPLEMAEQPVAMGLRTRMQAVPADFGNGIRLHPSSHCRRQQLATEADAEHGLLRLHRLADELDFGLEVRELLAPGRRSSGRRARRGRHTGECPAGRAVRGRNSRSGCGIPTHAAADRGGRAVRRRRAGRRAVSTCAGALLRGPGEPGCIDHSGVNAAERSMPAVTLPRTACRRSDYRRRVDAV